MNNHIQQVKVTIAKMPDSVLSELEQYVYDMNRNEEFDGGQFHSFAALVIGYGAAWDAIEEFKDVIEQQQREIERLRTFLESSIETNTHALRVTNDKWFAGVVFAYKEVLGLLFPKEEETNLSECDWCGESVMELSHPHMFDMAIGKRMCEGCWNHDREVYKGSYGEDIGPFKPIGVKEETEQ